MQTELSTPLETAALESATPGRRGLDAEADAPADASVARSTRLNMIGGEAFSESPGLSKELLEQLVKPSVAARVRSFAESDSWSSPPIGAAKAATRRAWATIPFFVVADAIGLALCGVLSLLILMTFISPEHAPMSGRIAVVALLPMCLVFMFSGLYSEIWVHPIVEFRQMAHLSAMALAAAAFAGMAAGSLALWCLVAMPLTIALAPLPRMFIRSRLATRNWWGYPTLVIGSGRGAIETARLLLDVPRSGLRPVLLTDPTGVCRASNWRVINDQDNLASVVRAQAIRHAVISLPDCSLAELGPLLDRYSRLMPRLLVLSDTSTLPSLWGAARPTGQVSGVVVHNQLLRATLLKVKRAIDLGIALLVVTLGAPLIVGIALAVRVSSRGPVFFAHTRIGRGGRKIRAWKFRSMHVDGDRILKAHLDSNAAARVEWEAEQKLRRDPRVTGVGRFLRATSLDELPQVWNVLVGEMSLVGPRPIVADEVNKYGQIYEAYSQVKPGVTGLWQVSGRSNLSYADRVKLDEFYVRHWSLWLDIYILGKTFVAVLCRHGAC